MKKILIVEDDKALAKGIALVLDQSGYNVQIANDIKSADELILTKKQNLIILDINLPDGNGLELCRKTRKTSSVPIIMLTVNDMELDEVSALESGADDYITKPFSIAVLRARVQSVFRRFEKKSETLIKIDMFEFDFDTMNFTKNDKEIILSKGEQKLLKYLVANKGIIMSRDKLIDRVWSEGEEVFENALSVTVKRLREKLEDNPTKPLYIKTIYGIGYTWAVL